MGIMDFFRPVHTISPAEVRKLIAEQPPDSYNLMDVRQPREYQQLHLPGAMLIPMEQLKDRAGELDPAKPTVVYCRSGNRSQVAAGMLRDAGFEDARNMEGGMMAWEGAVAEGPPEAGMAWFGPGVTGEEMAALAWLLEDGTHRFYISIAEETNDAEALKLFGELDSAELHHKDTLIALYKRLSGREPDVDFPRGVIGTASDEPTMEGGVALADALTWANGKPLTDVLEFMVAQEANALDLYIKMQRASDDPGAQEVFAAIGDEEHAHLERLMRAYEERV
jgi:rhodanese-related sulfurtransferase/rubrerythrin